MFYFENLLRNEYFPTELPPCFTSENFADNYCEIRNYVQNKNLSPSDPLIFSGYKNTNSRRKFAIPNPYHYAKAVDVIVNNSTCIFSIYNASNASLTVPLDKKPDSFECYKKPTTKIADSKEKIGKLYQNNLYEIRLDIQSFFDSVYTHSVAWAMHTKSFSKKHKQDKSLSGNMIDSCLQNLNSGQTNGILVGNAVSRIVAEIILCSVDKELKSKIQGEYLRYVDDYYIFIKDSSLINDIISIFRQELARYGLMLNENKLQINESPFIYGKSWVEQMRAYARLAPQILLEKAIIEYHLYKDIAILKYALNIISVYTFSHSEWESLQPTIFNIWVRFPNVSKTITIIFKKNEENISRSLLKKSIYSILDVHIALKNDEEVIWVIWISKIFNINLSKKYISLILDTDNWLAIIILLDIISSRKKEKTIEKIINRFRNSLVLEYFSDPNLVTNMHTDIWLLAYEADKNKWLNTSSKDTFLFARKHPFFKMLRELDIDFYRKDYTYGLIEDSRKKSNTYANHKKLRDLLEEYKTFFKSKNMTVSDDCSLDVKTECFVQKFVDVLSDIEDY